MERSKDKHTFHIPVMGIGFTIDSPLKVAPFGISSSISLVDDILIEKMREFHSKRVNRPFEPINKKTDDFRAKRITAYLNLLDDLIKEKFNSIKESVREKSKEFEKYIEMLPDYSEIKKDFEQLLREKTPLKKMQDWIQQNLSMGSIDVNIMTKLDITNYKKNKALPVEYNDAHAALRGFAKSKLNSSIILSAGLNPRLYSYFEKFEDFYPDLKGRLKKKIVLKVSDYRSAFIQGKFFAKKGLWVSEYRIESGLNCGGHAFATDGYLMGPILDEFSRKRKVLLNGLHEIFINALQKKNKTSPKIPLPTKFTAQGGVGTTEEHQFLLENYNLDSIGWGTPFLLVPEASTVDKFSRDKLSESKEKDLYLSGISPLGVPFNSLRGNTKDITKQNWIDEGRPGSPCPKKYILLNTEFTDKAICLASRQYQNLKLKDLKNKNLPLNEYNAEYEKVVEKSCLCVGLGTPALLVNNLDTKVEGPGVSVCPGPNMAYFSETWSLKEMVDHIYGRINIIKRNDRPHVFVKELQLYLDYFKNKIDDTSKALDEKQLAYLLEFRNNLNSGIDYYLKLFNDYKIKFQDKKKQILEELDQLQNELNKIVLQQASP